MRAAFNSGQYVPHCTRHRTTALVPRREHRMARCRESRRRNRRCRSGGGEISRRGGRSAIVPARVAAIDLNRLRAHFDVAVTKRKRAGEFRLLGHSDATLPASPGEARLETFPNPAPQRDYRIHFETDDFTSVCPVTGQPDFARIDIDYVPDRLCVESKSLKFYLASYRNEHAFNEAVTNRILDDFVKACAPREAIVTAQFSARRGIALTVRAEHPDKTAGREKE